MARETDSLQEVQDLLQQLAVDISPAETDCYSLAELMARLGWLEHKVRSLLKVAQAQGRLALISTPMTTISGRSWTTIKYRFLPAKPAKNPRKRS